MAAQTDAYERQAGQLASRQARDSRVKDFGRTMVQDHTMSSADLMKAAQDAKVAPPASPPPLRADQQQMLSALQSAGANFDKTYLDQQVQVHREALSLMQVYAANGADAPLRAAAGKTAPVVEHHLMMAEGLRRDMK